MHANNIELLRDEAQRLLRLNIEGLGQMMAAEGVITEVNEALRADPALANSDPLGAGWFFKVKLSDATQIAALMDETSYTTFSA